MANFFRKLARILAIVLAVIAIILVIIACIIYPPAGAALLPSAWANFTWATALFWAAAAAVLGVMIDPEAALGVISRCFDAAGEIITTAIKEVVEIGTEVGESLFSAFTNSPVGFAVLAFGGLLAYKALVPSPVTQNERQYV